MGALKAHVGGAWVDVGSGMDEVYIGTSDPIATVPTAELWYDSDAPAVLNNDYRWNTAWGQISSALISAEQTGVTTLTDLTGFTSTFTAVAGRAYKASWLLDAYGSVAAQHTIYASLNGAQTIVHSSNTDVAGRYVMISGSLIFQLAAGSRTVKLHGQVNTGTMTIANSSLCNGRFTIEDVGPVAGSLPAPDPTPAWIPLGPLLINGWVNYGSPFGPSYYRKVGDIVSLKGLVNGGSPATSVICQLPVGYRPPYNPIIATPCNTGMAEMRIDTNGNVNASSAVPVGVGLPAAWLSLTGVTFSVT